VSTIAVILIGFAGAAGWAVAKIQRRKRFLRKLLPLMQEGVITKIAFQWKRDRSQKNKIIPVCSIEGKNWCLSLVDDDVETRGSVPAEVQILFFELKARKVIGILSPNLWGITYDQSREVFPNVRQKYPRYKVGAHNNILFGTIWRHNLPSD
jgi:hypothetical protein